MRHRRYFRSSVAELTLASDAQLRRSGGAAVRSAEDPSSDEILVAREAWEYLRVGRTKFYEEIRKGTIPHTRLGDRILCYRSALYDLTLNGKEKRYDGLETSDLVRAAIGVYESNFQNEVSQVNGVTGAGVFQLTVSSTTGVSMVQESDLTYAANYAANILADHETALAATFPSFTPAQLEQAIADEYNSGPGVVQGNPSLMDAETTGNDCGNVLGIGPTCF